MNLTIDNTYPADIYWLHARGNMGSAIPVNANDMAPLFVERQRTGFLDVAQTFPYTIHYAENFVIGNGVWATHPIFPGDALLGWTTHEDMVEAYVDALEQAAQDSYQFQIVDSSDPDALATLYNDILQATKQYMNSNTHTWPDGFGP